VHVDLLLALDHLRNLIQLHQPKLLRAAFKQQGILVVQQVVLLSPLLQFSWEQLADQGKAGIAGFRPKLVGLKIQIAHLLLI